ncbi:hypothetical protein BD410DRAFT_768580 [Rickenella mellea]|uniref:Uncharacterized protein n=1 Tax=Rickenella mellea TaxID=50990 RepID=A0A4Y7Q8D2_9AGAM|nr:hypothetical protein BD410DRAFT_768580 [Rickenella mellea]
MDNPLVRIPKGSVQVVDADEEVFLLYTQLAAKSSQDGSEAFSGLGFVDSRSDTLSIKLDIPLFGATPSPIVPSSTSHEPKQKHMKRKRTTASPTTKTIEIEIAQDKTALRSRKGDTGSVLWKASVDLAQLILKQLHNPSSTTLFDHDEFAMCHVLELGSALRAGVGLLGILLSPWVRKYTATDLEPLLPLIRKNIMLNETNRPNALLVESLDWEQLLRMPANGRAAAFAVEPVDVIFVVDCIYNPSLLPALVETIDYFTIPGRTCVVIVLELRAEDVVREFLAAWLARDGWTVCRIDGEDDGPGRWMDERYAMWVGRKNILGMV